MIFASGQNDCDILCRGNKVDIVTCMIYFGHTVTNHINDSFFKPVINDFYVKAFSLFQ